MGAVDLLEQYRGESTERLLVIAASSDYSAHAQETAQKILRERGTEVPPPAEPQPSNSAPVQAKAKGVMRPIFVVSALLLAAINGYRLLSRGSEPAFPEGYDPRWPMQEVAGSASPPSGGAVPRDEASAVPAGYTTAAAPAAKPIASVAPTHDVAWTPGSGPLADPERVLVGTWIARVGDNATRSAFMADKVMFGTSGRGVADIVEAVQKNNRLKTGCIWLELFDTRRGIRRECTIFNDEPSAIDKTDPLSGKKSDLGTTFEWVWDKKAKALRFHFDADMLAPAADGKALLRFRTWVVRFGARSGEGLKLAESFPEHAFTRKDEDVYEIMPGRFLGSH